MAGQDFTFGQHIEKRPEPDTGTLILPENVARLVVARGTTDLQRFVTNGRVRVTVAASASRTWRRAVKRRSKSADLSAKCCT